MKIRIDIKFIENKIRFFAKKKITGSGSMRVLTANYWKRQIASLAKDDPSPKSKKAPE